jgi:hypothetical protein
VLEIPCSGSRGSIDWTVSARLQIVATHRSTGRPARRDDERRVVPDRELTPVLLRASQDDAAAVGHATTSRRHRRLRLPVRMNVA